MFSVKWPLGHIWKYVSLPLFRFIGDMVACTAVFAFGDFLGGQGDGAVRVLFFERTSDSFKIFQIFLQPRRQVSIATKIAKFGTNFGPQNSKKFHRKFCGF